jgi:predicted nucleic acid-binding protein
MNDRFFLDTNVFVYSFDRSAPAKARRAAQLIGRAVETRKGIVSYQVAQEFFNVALRRFAQAMSAADAEQYLATVFRPLMVVHSSLALYGEALRLAHRYHLSWFDSLIVAGALEGQCSILYTEDFRDGQQFGELRIENPFS